MRITLKDRQRGPPGHGQCGREVLIIRPHLLSESAQGCLLHDLREDEGQEAELEDKGEEEEEIDVDEKVKSATL